LRVRETLHAAMFDSGGEGPRSLGSADTDASPSVPCVVPNAMGCLLFVVVGGCLCRRVCACLCRQVCAVVGRILG
jgi:hypothetical protein